MDLSFSDFYLKKLSGRTTKLLLFGLDMLASFFSRTIAIFILYELDPASLGLIFSYNTMILLFLRGIAFYGFGTFSIILRFIGEKDFKNVFMAVTVSTLTYLLIYDQLPSILDPNKRVPVILVDFLICLLLTGSTRLILRLTYDYFRRSAGGLNTVIFGAGELGSMVEHLLRHNTEHNYRIAAFLDDNPKVHGKRLNGIQVFDPRKSFREVARKYQIKYAIIAINDLSLERRKEFIESCLANNVKVLKVPPSRQWLGGRLAADQLRNINFEDLLERPSIRLDQSIVGETIRGRVVLVTGCAGSIGSEIVRQLLKHAPHKIIGVDQAETPLADITLELKEAVASHQFLPIIGDVRDREKMERIFQDFRPHYVFHAAAYKHVPIMEQYPEEAIRINVEGTRRMADLAVEYGAEKFVMISTDKVVRPSNVMGASKRIAEIYVQSLNAHPVNRTQFITTRFGNVLGSNGSVIPIFRQQIEQRSAITLTHPDVRRFFMTIPEACQLVLEAGSMGRGGEIFVFDMGEPVRIFDLANKMIQMAGLIPGVDIEIKITGLRPGEKLDEEVLHEGENIVETHHPKIRKALVRQQDRQEVEVAIGQLICLANTGGSPEVIVQQMKVLVPEFISQNSSFSALDQERLEEENGSGKSAGANRAPMEEEIV